MVERKHAWGPRAENRLIGKEIPRIDALPKIVGGAKYTTDILPEGTLFAKLLTSPHAKATVTKLDVEPAKKIPGVRGVYVFLDMSAERGKDLRCDGALIAAVAADRPEIADQGVKAIVVEYNVQPHFVDEEDIEAAKKFPSDEGGPPKKNSKDVGRVKPLGKTTKGKPEEGFSQSKLVHQGYYGIQTISHMCLEPHGAHSQWPEKDVLDVHLSTQNVSGTPGQFAGAPQIGIDVKNVTVTCNYEGGGFGSKFAADEWGVASAVLARETGKPVQLILDRATDLKVAGVRPSGFVHVKIGANESGEIQAWESQHWGTPGYATAGIPITNMPYVFEFPNRTVIGSQIVCNSGPSRAWRAPPHPQLCVMTECAIDDVAMRLGLDSYDVFKANLKVTGELAPTYAAEMEIAEKLMDWKKKWHPHGKGPKEGSVKRGLGMAIHTWGGGAGPGACQLKVHPDGSVETFLGGQDIGTGTRTVIAITIAETFGIPLDSVKVNLGTSKYIASGPSGGSITVGGVTGIHRRASQTALWKIFDLVAAKYKVNAETLAAKDGQVVSGNEKVCTWKQACGLIGPMPLEVVEKGPKEDGLTSSRVGGVQMADVSVDLETGIVRMNKFVAVQDCGLIIDELTAKSQVYGAVIMGISYALTEERVMDNKTGRYINADLKNYKLARIGDIGEIVVEMYQPDSEYNRGVIGLGEPPVISPGTAISNAVCNAIGVRVPVLPLTPKRVLDALKGGAV